MSENKRRWAFFSYAHNLGDFSRALETAKGVRDAGHEVAFFNHGGRHLQQIDNEGIASYNLKPEITQEQDDMVMAINQFRVPIGTPLPFTEEELTAMVEADLEALDTFKPDGVYCGLNISSMISVPYTKLPRVTMVPTTLCPEFYKLGLATFPNTMEKNVISRYIIPEVVKKRFFNKVMLKDVLKETVTNFNKVRRKYGLSPIYNQTDFVKSDLVILPDLPELSGLPENRLPEKYKYSGPIFSMMDHLKVPDEVRAVYSREGVNIYCALGSSGMPEVLKQIIDILRSVPEFNIVCATTTILSPEALGVNSERFYATRYLPAHLVNEMADIAITHGGQGTIQTAVWAGTPVVGFGFQSEQQQNIDGLVRAGMAERIVYYKLNKQRLLKAVYKVLDPAYKKAAKQLQALVREHDGVKKSVELMNNLLA